MSSDEDRDVASLIRRGESSTVEFKSSLRYDMVEGKPNKELTKVAAKTISAFLNANGGTLLVGVDDNGDVVGIEHDWNTLRKANKDGFELLLRDTIRNHLGAAVGVAIDIAFEQIQDHWIAAISCRPHPTPVYFQEGDRVDFYVRDGNRTQSLDTRSAHGYIASHWSVISTPTSEMIKQAIQDALRTEDLQQRLGVAPPKGETPEPIPPWLRVGTRSVLNLYLRNLSRSHGWNQLYIISPWLSEFGGSDAAMGYTQLLSRLKADRATAYVVTRPPEDDWHRKAIELIGATGRANVSLVPDLHAKLYLARTDMGAFALLASANFTKKSLHNREIGILITAQSGGKNVFRELQQEARDIYRTPSRTLLYRAAF